MDDKSWNDFLLGNAGVRTGGIMNEVGLQSRYKPKTTPPPIRPNPGQPQQPATPQYNPTPRPLTEAEKKRQEKAALRQARIDALPSTAVYWTWWKRFSTLDGRVRSVASFAGTGSILIGIASFVVMGVWSNTVWAEYAVMALLAACIVLPLSLFAIYAARILEEYGANPFRTWAGLTDYGLWAVPFRIVYAILQTCFVLALLIGPPVGLWFAARWFGWL